MFSITRESVPEDALLRTFRGGRHPERWGRYADCFAVGVDRNVSLADFVFAFYTSALFRIERGLLRLLINAPSSRADARSVADGTADKFAAWYVGQRTATQLLMCDRYERTRSWFHVAPQSGGGTRLQFGSAVAARAGERADIPQRPTAFKLLLSFHVAYSQALLRAAKENL
ncbi:MAG TPA: hypothetical protein VHS76_09690 [Steroidobacteraceae bacterium]|jgi:hypothetical protein|nr:hypothetical protein [Steroidobacteraceae bacterium]